MDVGSMDSSDEIPLRPGLPLTSPTGRLDDKYELVREIGRGATGVVHEARNVWTHRRVALKRLHRFPTPAEEQRFVREARTAARLVHPNIVEVLDMGKDEDGGLFLVLELLEGESLEMLLARRGPLPLAEAIAIVLPLADALALAHEHGIVHRDVKPSNVVLARSGLGGIVPKLVDFGIARDLSDPTRATIEGGLVGTPHYMAPEQVLQEPVLDGRVDVWSLSVCLFEMLTGRLPFTSQKIHELLREIVAFECPAVSERALGVSAYVDDVLRRGLEADRESRTATMRAFQADLVALREEARPTHRPPPGPSAPPSSEEGDPTEVLPQPTALRGRRAPAVQKEKPLRLGVVWAAAEVDLQAVAGTLHDVLARPVDVSRFATYAELVDAVLESDVELGWLPPVAYVRARRARDVRLLFATMRQSGPSYHSALLGRTGVVDRLEDARGKRAAWVDGWSAAGYLVPRTMLAHAGVIPDTDLVAQGFLGRHEAVVAALLQGTAEIGATYCQIDPVRGPVGPWGDDPRVRVLAVSEPIPGDTLCAGPAVSPEEAEAMSILLLGSSRRIAPLIAAQDLSPGDPTHYDALERALLGS